MEIKREIEKERAEMPFAYPVGNDNGNDVERGKGWGVG